MIQGVIFANRVLRFGNTRVDFRSPGDRDCLEDNDWGLEEERRLGSPELGDLVFVESGLEVSALKHSRVAYTTANLKSWKLQW